MTKQNRDNDIYLLRTINTYQSITLKEFQTLFSFDLMSLNNARNAIVILTHINAYKRSIQTTFVNLYNIQRSIVVRLLNELVNTGLLKPGPVHRKTNIGAYVPLVGYSLTPSGKKVLRQLNDLLELKVSKLTR